MSETAKRLRKFAEYRRKQLERQRAEKIATTTGGISLGAPALFEQHAAFVTEFLNELTRFADYLDAGMPEYKAPLTEQEKNTWRQVKGLGYDVPAEIEAQL